MIVIVVVVLDLLDVVAVTIVEPSLWLLLVVVVETSVQLLLVYVEMSIGFLLFWVSARMPVSAQSVISGVIVHIS